jgi:hypothetical protein
VTVPVDEFPPFTAVGPRSSADTDGLVGSPTGCTVRVALSVTPAPEAEIVTSVETAGGWVSTKDAPVDAVRFGCDEGARLADAETRRSSASAREGTLSAMRDVRVSGSLGVRRL